MLTMQELAIQMKSSIVKDLLEDAAKADEVLLHVEDDGLARLLRERIGNSAVGETPSLKKEVFYLVGLKKHDGQAGGRPNLEDVVVYRCVTARGVWL